MKLLTILLLLFTISMLAFPASAYYSYSGTPDFDLTTIANGTINGEVYVGGGHGVEGDTTPVQPHTYYQNFTVPSGDVLFARLYVGVWGAKEIYNGTLQTTFNGNDLGTLTLRGKYDNNPNVMCTGHGVHWVNYNVTNITQSDFNYAVANTNQIHPSFDGRMYGIVLVAAVENPDMPLVQYWINSGHWNLNYNTPLNTATTDFLGAPISSEGTLTTVYLTGQSDDDDTLKFNNNLVTYDAADGCGSDEWGNSWCYSFDFDKWDLTNLEYSYINMGNNNATFDRGEDEYLHPALAVLVIEPWYFKPPYSNPYREGVPPNQPSGNYAPCGVPDFNQTQDIHWTKGGIWSLCGPTAVANSFWYFDSRFANQKGFPGDGVDSYPLVADYTGALPYNMPPLPLPYGPIWNNDDHRYDNVDNLNTQPWPIVAPLPGPQGELIERLGWYMNTDDSRNPGAHTGTTVTDMVTGINDWLTATTLDSKYIVKTYKEPDFDIIYEEVRHCEDVILLLGFWEEFGPYEWNRIGGHYVTVAGVNLMESALAFSDPFIDNAESNPGSGIVRIPHPPHGSDPWLHNDAKYVSHDFYPVLPESLSPGGWLFLPNYPVVANGALADNFLNANVPDEFTSSHIGPWMGGPVHVEIEYAIVVSPRSDLEIYDTWVPWPPGTWPEPPGCTVNYIIRNTGVTAALTSDTVLNVDGGQKAIDHVPVLIYPGGYYKSNFNTYAWQYTLPTDTIDVGADFLNVIPEIDETNNWLSKTWICGDVHEDGNYADICDAVDIMFVSPSPDLYSILPCPWAGDVNNDGIIDIYDVVDVFYNLPNPPNPFTCKCQI